jgi:hypothetical protein
MRYFVGKRCDPKRTSISIVNPASVPQDTAACPHFHRIKVIRVAWGVRRLVDKIPHRDARYIKGEIIGYLGHTDFYRKYRLESGLSPKQQETIRKIFRARGYMEEPAYEYYTEEYDWK